MQLLSSSQIFPKEIREELLRAGRAVALSVCEENSLDKHNYPFRVGVMIPTYGNITGEPS